MEAARFVLRIQQEAREYAQAPRSWATCLLPIIALINPSQPLNGEGDMSHEDPLLLDEGAFNISEYHVRLDAIMKAGQSRLKRLKNPQRCVQTYDFFARWLNGEQLYTLLSAEARRAGFPTLSSVARRSDDDEAKKQVTRFLQKLLDAITATSNAMHGAESSRVRSVTLRKDVLSALRTPAVGRTGGEYFAGRFATARGDVTRLARERAWLESNLFAVLFQQAWGVERVYNLMDLVTQGKASVFKVAFEGIMAGASPVSEDAGQLANSFQALELNTQERLSVRSPDGGHTSANGSNQGLGAQSFSTELYSGSRASGVDPSTSLLTHAEFFMQLEAAWHDPNALRFAIPDIEERYNFVKKLCGSRDASQLEAVYAAWWAAAVSGEHFENRLMDCWTRLACPLGADHVARLAAIRDLEPPSQTLLLSKKRSLFNGLDWLSSWCGQLLSSLEWHQPEECTATQPAYSTGWEVAAAGMRSKAAKPMEAPSDVLTREAVSKICSTLESVMHSYVQKSPSPYIIEEVLDSSERSIEIMRPGRQHKTHDRPRTATVAAATKGHDERPGVEPPAVLDSEPRLESGVSTQTSWMSGSESQGDILRFRFGLERLDMASQRLRPKQRQENVSGGVGETVWRSAASLENGNPPGSLKQQRIPSRHSQQLVERPETPLLMSVQSHTLQPTAAPKASAVHSVAQQSSEPARHSGRRREGLFGRSHHSRKGPAVNLETVMDHLQAAYPSEKWKSMEAAIRKAQQETNEIFAELKDSRERQRELMASARDVLLSRISESAAGAYVTDKSMFDCITEKDPFAALLLLAVHPTLRISETTEAGPQGNPTRTRLARSSSFVVNPPRTTAPRPGLATVQRSQSHRIEGSKAPRKRNVDQQRTKKAPASKHQSPDAREPEAFSWRHASSQLREFVRQRRQAQKQQNPSPGPSAASYRIQPINPFRPHGDAEVRLRPPSAVREFANLSSEHHVAASGSD
eukprot:Blabericola_migrator_1__241@NODE_1063_length_5557_cov_73_955920_g730_i0_p1_GENE_NODE_1063_length_5557_cov_73_955920_g730_i0NODE_1063_length_5557_cov_73_955920_g730_i0_p1_ORF_typecomplete_len977_score133_65KELK/PF15796_5/1_1KELK/PF15796_5/1_1e03_NODE_1063_length_5557_cov_73_955920_g730_i0703000